MFRKKSVPPCGTVTYLLTDVEKSTPEWRSDANGMDGRLRRLERLVASAVEANGGALIKARGEGDSAFAVFDRASRAVVAAYEIQRESPEVDLRVRAAIHTGEARLRDGDYYGVTPNRAARLRSLAHGGQIVVSRVSADLAEAELPDHLSFVSLGTYRIRDWPRVERLFGVRGPEIDTEFPPLRIWGDLQRALMTIVVVDEAGSTAKFERMSEDQVVVEQRSLARTIREAFEDARGSFLRVLGDGGLALFDDPISGVAFARAVVGRSDYPLRIGIQAGVVELVGDDVAGSAIYKAFELCGQASAGEILTTRTFAELVPSGATIVADREGLYAVNA